MAKRPKVNPNEMSFLDHLEELRWHLIRATLAVVVAGIFAFIAKEFIFDIVLLGPVGAVEPPGHLAPLSFLPITYNFPLFVNAYVA